MHRAYVPIENALLWQLYVEERLTAEAIAARIGCSPITILRRLRTYGIRARSRGPLQQGKTLNGNLTWSANLAWSVGLMATDGNLSGDGRHVSLVSKDRQLLETFRACLNLHGAIAPHRSGHGRCGLRVQWSDRRFYDWLIGIGLTPAKSLTLGPLAVPDECFVDFFASTGMARSSPTSTTTTRSKSLSTCTGASMSRSCPRASGSWSGCKRRFGDLLELPASSRYDEFRHETICGVSDTPRVSRLRCSVGCTTAPTCHVFIASE